jgi:hypothetical protein
MKNSKAPASPHNPARRRVRSDDSQFLTVRRNAGCAILAPHSSGLTSRAVREQPVVAFKVRDSVLAFAVFRYVKSLNDFGARGFGVVEMCIHVGDEDGETLRAVAELRGAAGAGIGLIYHDPGIADVQLCSADWVAVAIMFDEAECFDEPVNGSGKILVFDMRQNRVWRHRAILKQAVSSRASAGIRLVRA